MAGYRSDPRGFRTIGRSSGMQSAMLKVGQAVAGAANASGHSEYEVRPATVTAGWNNEKRAGAIVYESVRDWRDSRDRTLVSIAERMRNRAAGGSR